ncbi:MAG: hypothetical protein N2317_00120 [Syntrophales bacterium]|nr:hypothetical protein [Syntrophales bacterium]
MKIKLRRHFIYSFVVVVFLLGGTNAVLEQTASLSSAAIAEPGVLENVSLSLMDGRERVVVQATRLSGVQVEQKAKGEVVVKLDNVLIPDGKKKTWGEGILDNVVKVVSVQEEGVKDSPRALIYILVKAPVPFSVLQREKELMIDFNVGSLKNKKSDEIAKTQPSLPKVEGKRDQEIKKGIKERRLSVDLQDADIRAALRLIAEHSGQNIVVSPEVKGNVTLSMKNVSWEQVLDTIIETNGLVRKDLPGIITVMTLARHRQIESEKQAAEESRRKAEEALNEKRKKEEAEKGVAKQLMIEAKILEVSDTFVRDLGVYWGGGISSGDVRVIGGTGIPLVSTAPAPLNKLTGALSLSSEYLAVNFPTVTAAISPTLGIIVGGHNKILSARISALETTGEGKVISSPRVLTTNGEKAVIEQGEEVPVVTPGTSTNPPTTSYRPAVLRLEVLPTIIPGDRILLTIQAKNDRPNKAEKDPSTGNMPIYTNKVDSKVAVKDGDTVVIGGIMKTEDSKGVHGVPWLHRIPVLGWLFKDESVTKTRREMLIFVTPRIVKDELQIGQKG